MHFPPALSLSDETRFKIRTFLRKKFSGDGEGCCFFRRFDVLLYSPSKLIEITNHFGPGVSQTISSLDDIPEKIIKKNLEFKYSNFAGFTSSRAIREEPIEFSDKEIYINSNNYCQVDLTLDFTFKFNKVSQLCNPVTPQTGDLIFIFISNKTVSHNNVHTTKKSIKPRADFWCIVSEQFLHAWTLIQYDWHESFDKLIVASTPVEKKETVLREKMFSGNRLMTNSWLKYKLAIEDSGKTLSIEESKEKYWHLRTEYASRKWVDIYAAIVLVGRYGELPCPSNRPNNKSATTPDRLSWNLPDIFMTKFLQKSLEGCEITNHLLNYDKWAPYSNASVMFSFYNKGMIKGFFDDLPTIKATEDGQKQLIPKNNLSIKLSDFPGKIDVIPVQYIENDNSWVNIVRNNNNMTTKKGENISEKKSANITPTEKSEDQQNQKLVNTFTLQLNLNIAKNWAEVVDNDGDDW